MPADLLIYLAVVAALWMVYVIRKRRRARGKRRFGDADAYEGNLIIPPSGGPHGGLYPHRSHSEHVGHADGHIGHGGSHAGHGGSHIGHGTLGDHH
jgi:hypothetical protein